MRLTFLAPGFAWGFLSLALITALYLLRRRYLPRQVPSTFLWEKALRDSAANRPFQKLRKNLLLPLQLLAAACLVLALMQPVTGGGKAGKTVLILDLSASMQTRSGGRSRLEEAREAAAERISRMTSRAPGSSGAIVISFSVPCAASRYSCAWTGSGFRI